MNKYILGIEGMRCGMCEVHVEETITRNMKVKKANASRVKNVLVVITKQNISEEDFHKVLDPTGYKMTTFTKTAALKKLFG